MYCLTCTSREFQNNKSSTYQHSYTSTTKNWQLSTLADSCQLLSKTQTVIIQSCYKVLTWNFACKLGRIIGGDSNWMQLFQMASSPAHKTKSLFMPYFAKLCKLDCEFAEMWFGHGRSTKLQGTNKKTPIMLKHCFICIFSNKLTKL